MDTFQMVSWPLLVVAAYVLGSVPFAQLLARLNGVDLRLTGTGNVGAGNLRESVGVGWAVTAAVLDGLKGLIPVLIARFALDLGLGASGVAGLAAVAGHNWSLFMRGRSGRGLATSAGLLIALDPVLVVWVGGWSVAGWRIGGGMAGFIGWGLLPLTSLAMGRPATETMFLAMLTAVLIGRRMQGNGEAPADMSDALRRGVFDTDPSESIPQTLDETSRP
jgi:acyl phosphate:glycerol-3-phosphate acyltransferase